MFCAWTSRTNAAILKRHLAQRMENLGRRVVPEPLPVSGLYIRGRSLTRWKITTMAAFACGIDLVAGFDECIHVFRLRRFEGNRPRVD